MDASPNLTRRLCFLFLLTKFICPILQVLLELNVSCGFILIFSGRCVQTIYGHHAVVTCLARSESNSGLHYYVASGACDGLVLLWIFNGQTFSVHTEFGIYLFLPRKFAFHDKIDWLFEFYNHSM